MNLYKSKKQELKKKRILKNGDEVYGIILSLAIVQDERKRAGGIHCTTPFADKIMLVSEKMIYIYINYKFSFRQL